MTTINDLPLTGYNILIRKRSGDLSKLARDGERKVLRQTYRQIIVAAVRGYFRTWLV